MKYTETELEILRTKGKAALDKFHKVKRKCSSTRPGRPIESKKRKEKYKIPKNLVD